MMPVSVRRYWPIAAIALALGAAGAAAFLRPPTVQAQMLEACLEMIDQRNGPFPRPELVTTSSLLSRPATPADIIGEDPEKIDYRRTYGSEADRVRQSHQTLLQLYEGRPGVRLSFVIEHARDADAARYSRSLCSYVASSPPGDRDQIPASSVKLDGASPFEYAVDHYVRASRAAQP